MNSENKLEMRCMAIPVTFLWIHNETSEKLYLLPLITVVLFISDTFPSKLSATLPIKSAYLCLGAN